MSILEPAEQQDQIKALVPIVRDWHQKAVTFVVADAATCEQAGSMVTELARVEKSVHETFDPIVAAAHEAHKVAVAQRGRFLDPVLKAIATLKASSGRWMREESERRRLELLERERQEREAEEARRLEEAAALESVGATREAEALLEEPIFVPAAPSTRELAPKIEGMTLVDDWICEINDKAAIVAAVAGGMLPLAALEINERYFRAQAKLLKGEFRGAGFVVKNVPKPRRTADRGGL